MFYLILFVISIIAYKLYQKYTIRGMCTCKTKMTGKVVIVTGANTGIGFETAKNLAERGARVILACRDVVKGTTARDKIKLSTEGNVVFKQLDLASFSSVRKFADDILTTEARLDVLINNAGTGSLDNALTADNLPIEAQVNHFGPFLLTNLLLPLLKTSAPSRIVNVSSVMHRLGTIDHIDKQTKSFIGFSRVYSNTKLANVLFTKKLSDILKGTGVTVNCLHPGGVNTEIFKNKYSFNRFLISLIFKTPLEGAQTSIHLAVSPDLSDTTGLYFSECRQAATSKRASDVNLSNKLWELSEKLVYQNKNL